MFRNEPFLFITNSTRDCSKRIDFGSSFPTGISSPKSANFGPVKGLKKIKGKQRNQNFTKESEKIVIRKLGYRKDSDSKTGVQKR
jgi:hypothetical protein